MNFQHTLIRVALPVPLHQAFDYLLDDSTRLPDSGMSKHNNHTDNKTANSAASNDKDCDNITKDIKSIPLADYAGYAQVGARVRVPFGRQQLVGIILALPDTSNVPPKKLKAASALLDSEPILCAKALKLAQFLASYYHYPLGDTLSVMLPAKLRRGGALELTQPYWQVCNEDVALAKNAHKQQRIFNLVAAESEGVSQQQLLSQGADTPTLKKLAAKGFIICHERLPKTHAPKLKQAELSLHDEQQAAFAAIHTAFGGYHGFLLAGVTGSGKTEVYLQLIWQAISQGKQVLVLVPEIGLTPQTVQRFSDRFAANIVTLHSHMSEGERLAAWAAVKAGSAHIVIGTRLSVLTPFFRLGLIVVDEAHDTSYKQQTTLRYHARDVAMWRAKEAGCPIVLGSATPSFESLERVQAGKLTRLNLTQRAGSAKPPQFKILDARGQSLDSKLSQKAIEAMRHTLAKGEQVLVFLNRRGYAPALLCDACGKTVDCPRCDAHLTLHHQPYTQLVCHHCDWRQKAPKHCPSCGSDNLHAIGTGTEKLEESLHMHFADTPILRVDADSTRKKGAWQTIYAAIGKRESCILLGTQMLAKGHHFEHVTLVVMPNVDRGFLSPDFRAPERVAQLITQVAGRAGRGQKPGMVLIQSLQPDNPLLLSLVSKGYMAFAQTGLAERKQLRLPPYTHTALVRVDSTKPERTKAALEQIKMQLGDDHITLWGPLTAPMAKLNNRFHGHLLLLCASRSHLQQVLAAHWVDALALDALKYCRASVDIDPVEW